MIQEKKQDNGLMNIVVNILIPSLILMKGAKYIPLSSVWILVLALSFPFLFGMYDLVIKRKTNFISILGFVSVLISGIVGVFELPPEYIAYKEASIPFIIGVVILGSRFTSSPLGKKMFYNKEIFNIERIEGALDGNKQQRLDVILNNSTVFLFVSFMVSAVLNFVLAKIFIQSNPGTEAFNNELGKMTLYSYPIIVVPSLLIIVAIFWNLYSSIKRLSQLTSDEILNLKK